MVIMSEEAYTRYTPGLSRDALLLIEEDLVKMEKPPTKLVYTIPATRIAEELGRRAVANIVMLGFLTAINEIVSVEAMKKSVLDSVPKGTEELNRQAFERGYEYGLRKADGE
jgi:2-oxoglutarate ferredoxin oxidoreductase subunit gamma